MTAITIQDLNNAKVDVNHIADIANSTAMTATDRLGHTKLTVLGAVTTIRAFNSRGAWAPTTAYAVKDLVDVSGTWYVAVMGHTSGTVFADDAAANWRVYQGVTSGELSADTGADDIGFSSQLPGSKSTTAGEELRTVLRSSQFELIDPTGVNDSTLGCAMAIAALRTLGGGEFRLGRGTFLLNGVAGSDGILTGLFVPYTSSNGIGGRIQVIGDGKASVLKAGNNNMLVARFSDSHGGISGVTYDGGGKSGVWALGVLPESTTQVTSVVNQNYNKFSNFYISGCAEGIVMQCGPKVGGADSGCWYNNFIDYQIFSTTRATWLRSPINMASGCNGNTFMQARNGQNMNVGIQIDSGGGNTFYAVHGEGINVGVTPNAIPTAVIIKNVDAWGTANDGNQFYGCRNEANTRDLNNGNASTAIFGGDWNAEKFGGSGVPPGVLIGATPSLTPLVLPGLEYGEGVSGYASGYFAMKKEIADIGFPWGNWGLDISKLTNVASVTSVQSKFKKLGDLVDWHFNFQFQASGANTEILIDPPLPPNSPLYGTLSSRNPFYSLYVSDGTGINKSVESGWTNTGKLYIKAPAAWNLSGNNNSVSCCIRYHI